VASRAAAEREAATQRFIALLAASGVDPEGSWDDAMKRTVNHADYRALQTLGDRKAAFERWGRERREAAEAAARAEERRRKVDFLTLLKGRPELTSRTRYPEAEALLGKEARWLALADEPEREELYEEYALSLERKEGAERRAARQARMAALRALLEREAVSAKSQWRKVHAALGEAAEMIALDKVDRLSVFEEYIGSLEEKEEQAKQAEREAARRADRKKRDAFRALLRRRYDEGLIPLAARWRDVAAELEAAEEHGLAAGQPGSTPQELFDDFMEQARETYSGHRRLLRGVSGAPPVTAATTADEFAAAIASAADAGSEVASLPRASLAAYVAELKEKAREEAAEMERSIRKQQRSAIEAFQGALRGLMGATLTSATTWQEVAAVVSGKAFASALAEPLQRQAFSELHAEVKAAEDKEAAAATGAAAGGGEKEAGGEEGGERKRHKKRERRRDEGSDDDDERRKRKKEKRDRRRREKEAGEASESG